MGRLSKHSVKNENIKYADRVVKNFMNGNSYSLSPLETLKMIAASSIFGEPQYYRAGGVESSKKGIPQLKNINTLLEYSIFADLFKDVKTAADVFTRAIDESLVFDFKGTLDLALNLRTEYYMRLNPSVIFIRASMHPSRPKFNDENPGYMKNIGKLISIRPDDLTNQFDYYMYLNGSKNGLSSLVKRTWAEKLESYSKYQLNKYKGKSLIDLVRISHASNNDLSELIKTGTLQVKDNEQTWETLRSAGKSWKEIIDTIEIPHMALLRNLRGIFTEISDVNLKSEILQKLKDGVIKGKQFPFRYYSAYQAIQNELGLNFSEDIKDALEECLDISVQNMPKLTGKTACLSDNSGSAWGAFNSEYGSTTIATIANLSSLIVALQSDEGYVGVFGDNLSMKQISKRNGLLSQLEETSKRGRSQGEGTENGIWLFWDKAIKNKEHWDNVFIMSDQQAGHGGLYGTDYSTYKEFAHKNGPAYIDVLAMVTKYRKTVNPKVNVFSVQVGGYDNTVLPENFYRGALLGGWTGKEAIFAKALIDTWNQIENRNSRNSN